MLDEFIQSTLAQVDDLSELKVSLVAIRLLELKYPGSISTTQRELAEMPALSTGLGFAPQIALESALRRSVMRGTLLYCDAPSLDEPRYFLNTTSGHRAISAIELADSRRSELKAPLKPQPAMVTLLGIWREIERLEMIDVYPGTLGEGILVEEWMARGYSQDEIIKSVRDVMAVPRPKGVPHRTLHSCSLHLLMTPPIQPTDYFQAVVARTAPLNDVFIAYRELTDHLPDGHTYYLLQAAVGIFGSFATIQMMRRLLSNDENAIDDMIPMLSEQHEAEISVVRSKTLPDIWVRELIQLYETHFGLPPTSRIAQEIVTLSAEIKDVTVWRTVFQYAVAQNKRNWEYVRKMLANPSPSLFEPEPVNDVARYAFGEYKRRVSRGILDQFIAGEINAMALQISDQALWEAAFNKAASANALNWNYLRTVLSNPQGTKAGEVKDGRRKQGTATKQKGLSRRPQIEEYTESEREAARERARQRIEERAKRRTAPDSNNTSTS